MNAATLDQAIAQLDRSEKLALLEKLWALIEVEDLPVPPEIQAELQRRWQRHLADPASALTLDELMARVEAKRR